MNEGERLREAELREHLRVARCFWAIRAGVDGEGHDEFLRWSVVALSDPGLGDLKRLAASRDAFRAAYSMANPTKASASVSGIAGKFFRFVHEVEVGDLVLYPAIPDRKIYICRVEGGYVFRSGKGVGLRHQRRVRWIGTIVGSDLSESARRELGAARTFFRVERARAEIEGVAIRTMRPLC